MTTLTASEAAPAATDRSRRMLLITANLLPVEIADGRRTKRVRRVVLVALCLVVILVGAWYGTATLLTSAAADDLVSVQADVQRIRGQQGEFGELVNVRKDAKAVTTQLTVLLANDLSWARLNTSVRDAAPDGVRITSLTAQLNTDKDAPIAAPAAGGAGTAGSTAIGQISIAGSAPDKHAVAVYLDALARSWGVGNPMLVNASLEANDRYQFSLNVDITGKALGGRYTATPQAVPAGG